MGQRQRQRPLLFAPTAAAFCAIPSHDRSHGGDFASLARPLLLVAPNDLLDGRAQEGVLPIVVELDHAAEERGASALRLLGELAGAREDGLDVGGCRLLAMSDRTPLLWQCPVFESVRPAFDSTRG